MPAKNPFDSLAAAIRYALRLRTFLRETMNPEEARSAIETRLANREQNFLYVVERAILANPRSPYAKLLHHAGLELEDVRSLVGELGLDGALEKLYDAGVYLRLDEFKGRRPVQRNGLEFTIKPGDTDNPMLRADYESRTGGSRGVPSRLLVNFDHIVDRADNAYMVLFAHGVADRPQVLWHASPVSRALLLKKVGIRLSHLFTTAPLRRTREGLREAAFLYYTLIASRLFGRAIPWPRLAPRNDPFLVAHALSSLAARGQPGLLPGSGAGAVRVCRAAAERGLDLRGTVFHVAGEPLTPAKAAVFQSVGGRFMVSYVMSEMGSLGHSCARPHALDDMHLLADRVAMVQREVSLRSGGAVSALFFTSLLATSPKVMLNTESGDWADVEERDCGCTLGDMGYRKHLSNVRSYEKLTSEGVTFRGTLLHDLMEEILPSHFGGHPFDYQLVEEEDESGLPRVNILVSPRVGAVDEKDVIEKVMQVLEISHRGGGRIMAQQWRQAGTLRVVRREPYETPSSKILPLHVLQKSAAAGGRR